MQLCLAEDLLEEHDGFAGNCVNSYLILLISFPSFLWTSLDSVITFGNMGL